MAALKGSRVSGMMRAPIVDDVLSREGQMILSLLCVGHLSMAHPPLSGMSVRDVTQTHRVSGVCCGVLRLSLSLSLSRSLFGLSLPFLSHRLLFNFLFSSLLLLDCLYLSSASVLPISIGRSSLRSLPHPRLQSDIRAFGHMHGGLVSWARFWP